ncbi:MAG: hypothetical protein ACRDUW_20590 [Pseudonocardiaceae bacterium]
MTTSSRELNGSSTAGTAQSGQPAKTPSGNATAEIRQQFTHGDQLADAMEALAPKVELPAHVKTKVRETKETVQAKADDVQQHLQKSGGTLRDKAGEATLQAKTVTNEALAKLPAPVTGSIGQLTETVRKRPVPPAAVVLGVFVLFVLRRLLRGNR